jgi:acid stress-induced BolA-like protein IbaG/YrbA
VISADFVGMRPVARQQRVYAPLANLIADGTLHAVNISALTPDADG